MSQPTPPTPPTPPTLAPPRAGIWLRLAPGLRRLLRRPEGLQSVILMSFGGSLAWPPPWRHLAAPVILAWAIPMMLIGLFQFVVLACNWTHGRIWAGALNVLVWVALVAGTIQYGNLAFAVAFFVPFAVFAFAALVFEPFGAQS